MMATLLFGGTGVILNTVLVAAGVPGWLHPIFAVVGALVAMFFLTRTAVRLIQRAAPTHETYRVTRHDLAGCTGSLLFDADEKSGYAQIKDREGNVHNIKCRTAGEPLPKGTAILVVQYEEEQGTFVVSKSPV
jgi:membrane protein implicated in regulation of membrane protease activity